MNSIMRSALNVVGLVLLFLVTSTVSYGQEQPKPIEKVGSEQESQLWQRNREVLHTAHDPIDIRGIEEGDNDFRARTPILSQSNREVTYVDTEELRQRKLAMFERSESFASPLPLAKPAWNHDSRREGGPSSGTGERNKLNEEAEQQESDGIPLDIACLITFLMIVAALFARRWLLE